MRTTGTQVIGIRTPIIHEGNSLPEIVVDAVLAYGEESGSQLCDRDIIGVTEAVVARAQGNYATVEQIAADVRRQFPSGAVGVVFPILSRNRFSLLLKGIAAGADKLVVLLSYPADEVGNHLIAVDKVYDSDTNIMRDVFTESEFRARFGAVNHEFTGIDYLHLYREFGGNAEIILANDPREILKHTKQVIAADIHTRHRTKRQLLEAGAQKVIGLDDLLRESVGGSGYNPDYGLLGSNKATEERVKLFPRDCDVFVDKMKCALDALTGKNMEVLIYGDGGFKDPVGGIWELADPVISPAYTSGLEGTPNELKLKYLADNEFGNLSAEEARSAIEKAISAKAGRDQMGKMESEGTTPRRLTDLLGSLCDLVSGSGDKGTPLVLIQGYFDNYAT